MSCWPIFWLMPIPLFNLLKFPCLFLLTLDRASLGVLGRSGNHHIVQVGLQMKPFSFSSPSVTPCDSEGEPVDWHGIAG